MHAPSGAKGLYINSIRFSMRLLGFSCFSKVDPRSDLSLVWLRLRLGCDRALTGSTSFRGAYKAKGDQLGKLLAKTGTQTIMLRQAPGEPPVSAVPSGSSQQKLACVALRPRYCLPRHLNPKQKPEKFVAGRKHPTAGRISKSGTPSCRSAQTARGVCCRASDPAAQLTTSTCLQGCQCCFWRPS